MGKIIFNTSFYLLIIAIGYFFKRIHLLKKEDSQVFAKVIMNLTLPCVFFSSANGLSMNTSLLIYMVIGFVVNIVMVMIGYLLNDKEEKLLTGSYMIACSGYDIGNFVLPFITTFFSGVGVLYLCSFNIMNIVMSMGITYSMTCFLIQSKSDFSFQTFIKELLSSISFDVYILILIIACLHIQIPSIVLDVTSSIGSTNTFLVMMMIGLKLDFHIPKDQFKHVFNILGIRFIGACLFAFIVSFMPLDPIGKKVMMITFFGPMVSVSSVYAKKLGYEGEVVANATMMSILISMLMMTIVMIL